MLQFMYEELLQGPWRLLIGTGSSLGDRVISLILLVMVMAVVVVVLGIIFSIIDSVGIKPARTVKTVVDKKEVIPAHTTTSLVSCGKALVPIRNHHPEAYKLHFQIDRQSHDFGVEKEFFDRLANGSRIEVDYGFGRLSGACVLLAARIV